MLVIVAHHATGITAAQVTDDAPAVGWPARASRVLAVGWGLPCVASAFAAVTPNAPVAS